MFPVEETLFRLLHLLYLLASLKEQGSLRQDSSWRAHRIEAFRQHLNRRGM